MAGAAIRDAWGTTFATVADTSTAKQFHRMERLGPVTISGSNTYLYWMRGAGSGEPSGFVSRGHIVNPAAIDDQLSMNWANGNGAPRTTTTIGYFRLKPISDAMGYAGPSDGVCRQYKWYGIRGTFPDGRNYAFLSWSLPNVRVGGMVRTSFRDAEAFRYTDTYDIRIKAYRYSYPTCGEEVGWVNYKYVRIYQNGHLFYGWAVSASYFWRRGRRQVPHGVAVRARAFPPAGPPLGSCASCQVIRSPFLRSGVSEEDSAVAVSPSLCPVIRRRSSVADSASCLDDPVHTGTW